VLTKQEGVPRAVLSWLVAGALLVRGGDAPRAARGWLASGLGVLAAVGAWRLLVRDLPVEAGENYLSLESLAALVAGLGRLGEVAGRIGRDLASLEVWGPLWWVGALALVLLAVHRARLRAAGAWRPALALGVLLAGHTALVVVAYLVSGWRGGEYERLMNVTLSRLLLQHAGLVPLLWMLVARPVEHFALSPTQVGEGARKPSSGGTRPPTENV
jgi:hypothetical protein